MIEPATGATLGRLDIAVLRHEANHPGLDYITVGTEQFVALMPSDHRLAREKKANVRALTKGTFIEAADIAGPMRRAIEDHLAANGLIPCTSWLMCFEPKA